MNDTEYLFVTGRLVQGDVFVPQTKNMNGGPLTDLKGNPKVQYFIAVAVEKTDTAMMQTFAQIQQVAQAGFPGGESQRPDFAWKVLDGDDPKYAGKTGFAGCMVFRFTSGFPVKAYTKGAASQIVDPNQIKRGYYIRVAFTVKANGNVTKPGVYLNLSLVELVGYGEEIVSGPDAASVLATVGAAVLPTAASATPVAGSPPITPVVAGPITPAVAGPVTPAVDFLSPPIMTAKAGGASFQQFIDRGWTKEQMITEGYIVSEPEPGPMCGVPLDPVPSVPQGNVGHSVSRPKASNKVNPLVAPAFINSII